MNTACSFPSSINRNTIPAWTQSAVPLFSDDRFSCSKSKSDVFRAELEYCRYDVAELFEIRTGPHVMERLGNGRKPDALLITLQRKGDCTLRHRDRLDTLRPGDLTLIDPSLPLKMKITGDMHQTVLKVPRQRLGADAGLAERMTGLKITGATGSGRVAGSFLDSIISELGQLPAKEMARLLGSAFDVLATSALSSSARTDFELSSYTFHQMQRLRAYIDDHLAEAGLGARPIAAAHGMSVRNLNKLFQASGTTLQKFIWQRRLQRAAEALRDPVLRGRSITEIAHAWGFRSSSHFSRAFKAEFGQQPSAYRRSQAGDSAR